MLLNVQNKKSIRLHFEEKEKQSIGYENRCWWRQLLCLHWSALHWTHVSQLNPNASSFSSMKMWILNLPVVFNLVEGSKGEHGASHLFSAPLLVLWCWDGTRGLTNAGQVLFQSHTLSPASIFLNLFIFPSYWLAYIILRGPAHQNIFLFLSAYLSSSVALKSLWL